MYIYAKATYMFGNFKVADIIAYECSKIDNLCRDELRQGTLVSERDYVSALSTRIRDTLKSKFHIKCHSQTVRPRIENENGVDGIIIFKWEDEIKVGLFEGKRPQTTVRNHGWDYLSSRKVSHFSEQIENQHKWRNAFALWEMFFNEGIDGFESPPYEYTGSSCVWHNNAHDFMNHEKLILTPWTTDKLKMLLSKSCIGFYSIIFNIIICKEGARFKIDSKARSARIVNPFDDNLVMDIPLPLSVDEQTDPAIEMFLEKNNYESYTFVDLDKMGNIMMDF